jgi:SET domain-containing protein
VVSEREYKKRRLLYAKDYNNYWMELGHEYLDASRKSSLARFMNHSCMPNCCTVKWQARPPRAADSCSGWRVRV